VVPVGAGVTAAVCVLALWRHAAGGGGGGGAAEEVPYYREAVILHGIAALLELLAEPFYILASVHLLFGARVAVEFSSTLVKSLVTLGLLLAYGNGGSRSSTNGGSGINSSASNPSLHQQGQQ
ncbi:hypothetical protein Agub_g10648, partial [Astrephomene gubernaculifera]